MIDLLLAVCMSVQEPVVSAEPLRFSVTHDGAAGEFIDGRVYIMLTEGGDHSSVIRAMVIREMDEYIAQKLGLQNIQNKASKSKQ